MRINENNSARKYMQRHTALTESRCSLPHQVFGRNIIGSLSEVTYSVDLLFTNPQIQIERIFMLTITC